MNFILLPWIWPYWIETRRQNKVYPIKYTNYIWRQLFPSLYKTVRTGTGLLLSVREIKEKAGMRNLTWWVKFCLIPYFQWQLTQKSISCWNSILFSLYCAIPVILHNLNVRTLVTHVAPYHTLFIHMQSWICYCHTYLNQTKVMLMSCTLQAAVTNLEYRVCNCFWQEEFLNKSNTRTRYYCSRENLKVLWFVKPFQSSDKRWTPKKYFTW